jgi:hypothetical protein
MRAVRPCGGGIRLPYDDLIGAAAAQQSYFGHARVRAAPGELLDSTLVPAARVSTERPDRLGLG